MRDSVLHYITRASADHEAHHACVGAMLILDRVVATGWMGTLQLLQLFLTAQSENNVHRTAGIMATCCDSAMGAVSDAVSIRVCCY